jgi:hypothetical protein
VVHFHRTRAVQPADAIHARDRRSDRRRACRDNASIGLDERTV